MLGALRTRKGGSLISERLGSVFCASHILLFFFFFFQRLLHCSWDTNSAFRHVNIATHVNSNFFFFFLLFSVFSFQQNKLYPKGSKVIFLPYSP